MRYRKIAVALFTFLALYFLVVVYLVFQEVYVKAPRIAALQRKCEDMGGRLHEDKCWPVAKEINLENRP